MQEPLITQFNNMCLLAVRLDGDSFSCRIGDREIITRLTRGSEKNDNDVHVVANLNRKEFFRGFPVKHRHAGILYFSRDTGSIVDVKFKADKNGTYGTRKYILGDINGSGHYAVVLLGSRPWVSSLVHAQNAVDAIKLVTEGFVIENMNLPDYNHLAVDTLDRDICVHFSRKHSSDKHHPIIEKVLNLPGGRSKYHAYWVAARSQLDLDDWLAKVQGRINNNKNVELFVSPGSRFCKVVINAHTAKNHGDCKEYYDQMIRLFA